MPARTVFGSCAVALVLAAAPGATQRGGDHGDAGSERHESGALAVPWRALIGREASVPRHLQNGEEFVRHERTPSS
jgi:hypothetical protein